VNSGANLAAGANAFVERSKTLGERVSVKPRAGEEKIFADAVLSLVRSDGLIGAIVPVDHGGGGLGVGDIARITFNIARVSGSAGLIYAMHMSQAISVIRHGTGPFFEGFMRRMVRDQILIASGTSEKGQVATFSIPSAALRREQMAFCR
jgi:alkylation response protein AidB-like acyl-CoA dehydrogenase